MTAFTEFNIAPGPELEAAPKAAAIEAAIAECPEAAYHESGPLRYCSCGWIEAPELEDPTAPDVLSLEDKVDYLFAQAQAVEALVEQAAPLLAQAGPMLESLAPLLGQASSPMGRIFGSLLH